MRSFLLAVAAVVAATILIGYVGLAARPSFFNETLALLAFGTVGLYHYLVQVQKTRPQIFVPFYIATLVLKILAYGAYVFVTFRLDPEGAVPNAVYFIVLYFIFTGVEVFFVYRRITG